MTISQAQTKEKPPLCLFCGHLFQQEGALCCAAFPEGVPLQIAHNRANHRHPFKGDSGLRFQPVGNDQVTVEEAAKHARTLFNHWTSEEVGKLIVTARTVEEVTVAPFYLSKFDRRAVAALGYKGPTDAFSDIGRRLGLNPNGIKNKRDDFDPLHDNNMAGWHQQPLRPSRAKVVTLLDELSFDALTSLERIRIGW